jgi:hypothetical protein
MAEHLTVDQDVVGSKPISRPLDLPCGRSILYNCRCNFVVNCLAMHNEFLDILKRFEQDGFP